MPLTTTLAAAVLTVSQILAAMAANTTGLKSYQVPVNISGNVKKAPRSMLFAMHGTRYFQTPDRDALVMSTIPASAKAFRNIYASLGTPSTWLGTYDIVLASAPAENARGVYELRGTYKRQSSVDHILLEVNATTFDPVVVRWFYRNGATIVMAIQEGAVGRYRLPITETLEITFPSYRGNAVVSYGGYATNVGIPATIFGPPSEAP